MAIRIIPYTAEHIPAVNEFNRRLRQNSQLHDFALTEDPESYRFTAAPPRTEPFIAADEDGCVRGGYLIQWYPYVIKGEYRQMGHYRAPISEGVFDRRYTSVGAIMVKHAQQGGRLLFAVGMGGLDRPLPRMLRAMGWQLAAVPFWFRVIHAGRFLRNIGPLRQTRARRLLLDAAAFSGAGSLGIHTAQFFRTRFRDGQYVSKTVSEFGSWADEIWQQVLPGLALSAVRTADVLNVRYPREDSTFQRLRIDFRGQPAGWLVLTVSRLKNRAYFGDMKTGTIVDGVALPGHIDRVIAAGLSACRDAGADLVFSNQSHRDWADALRSNGFWQGPSNYLFGTSRGVNDVLGPLNDTVLPRIHFNRGDGDGRVNLT
jgi:hypothetical protein